MSNLKVNADITDMDEPIRKLQEMVPEFCGLFFEDSDKDFSFPDEDMYYYEYYHYDEDGLKMRYGVNYRAITTEFGEHIITEVRVDSEDLDVEYECSDFWVSYNRSAREALANRMTNYINDNLWTLRSSSKHGQG